MGRFDFLSGIQIYRIRKISAITAEILGIIFSTKNVIKLIYIDNESKSKIDMNNIINTEYIRIKVLIILMTIKVFFRFIFVIN